MPRLPRVQSASISYAITNRCSEARYMMTPDEEGEVHKIIAQCLKECQQKYEVEIYAYVFMGNHYHIDVRAPHMNLPPFMRDLQSKIAKRLNRFLGRRGSMFPERYHHDYVEPKDVAGPRSSLYTVLNPVKAGLVAHPSRWPGLLSHGTYRQHVDPHGITLTKLPYFKTWKQQWAILGEFVCAYCDEVVAQRGGAQNFLGRDGIFKTDWNSAPSQPKRSPRQRLRDKVRCDASQAFHALLDGLRGTIDAFRARASSSLSPLPGVLSYLQELQAYCLATGFPVGTNPPVLVWTVGFVSLSSG